MKVIGVKAESRQQGEFVFDSLKEAVEKKRVALDDIALVTREEDGKSTLHQTIDTGCGVRFTDRGINDKMMKRAGEEPRRERRDRVRRSARMRPWRRSSQR